MDWPSVLFGGLGGGLAVYVLQLLREATTRDKKARHIATLFRMEIEELRDHYQQLSFSPSEPLGINRPAIMVYTEHGAWRLFELFTRGKVAVSITMFYRSIHSVHEPIEQAQEALRTIDDLSDWQGLARSSAHKRIQSSFDDAREALLKNADVALAELRAWRALLPVDIGEGSS